MAITKEHKMSSMTDIQKLSDGLIGVQMPLMEVQTKLKNPMQWYTLIACLKEKKIIGEVLYERIKEAGSTDKLIEGFKKAGWC